MVLMAEHVPLEIFDDNLLIKPYRKDTLNERAAMKYYETDSVSHIVEV